MERTMVVRRMVLGAALGLVASACEGTTDPTDPARVPAYVAAKAPTLVVEQGAVLRGATVTVRVRNDDDVAWQAVWRGCKGALERRLGGKWVHGGEARDGACIAAIHTETIPPHGGIEVAVALRSDAPLGTYRFAADFARADYEDAWISRASNTFVIAEVVTF